jgi:hypothetical protein
MIQDPVDQ